MQLQYFPLDHVLLEAVELLFTVPIGNHYEDCDAQWRNVACWRNTPVKSLKKCVSRAKRAVLLTYFSEVFEIVPHSNDDLAPSKTAPPCTAGSAGPFVTPLVTPKSVVPPIVLGLVLSRHARKDCSLKCISLHLNNFA